MKEAPKNIRQIGGIDSDHKVYVEDYVITYMRMLGDNLIKENKENYAAVVLLGYKNMSGNNVETYINGVVRIDDFSLWGETTFTNEIWSAIYDKVKTYYEDEEIVGWMFAGCDDVITDKNKQAVFINIHKSNFVGKNMLFIEYNCEEREEKVYDYINGSFIKRKGFYVYYQKNETMHNYMIAMNEEKLVECESDNVVKEIRDVISHRSEELETKKLVRSIYATGMLVAAVALLIGSAAIYKMNSKSPVTTENTITNDVALEDSLPEGDVQSVLSNSGGAAETGGDDAAAADSAAGVENIAGFGSDANSGMVGETPAPEADQVTDVNEAANDGSPAAGEADNAEESDNDTEEVRDTMPPDTAEAPADDAVIETSGKAHTFYTVKSGDSLGKISERIWGTVEYVDAIMELNNIEDPDKIYEGQKLWLPDK